MLIQSFRTAHIRTPLETTRQVSLEKVQSYKEDEDDDDENSYNEDEDEGEKIILLLSFTLICVHILL